MRRLICASRIDGKMPTLDDEVTIRLIASVGPMRQLPNTWMVGAKRAVHRGFAVYKVGPLNRPADELSQTYASAEAAVKAAEKLGVGYAAFRTYACDSDETPLEMIRGQDLPVTVEP